MVVDFETCFWWEAEKSGRGLFSWGLGGHICVQLQPGRGRDTGEKAVVRRARIKSQSLTIESPSTSDQVPVSTDGLVLLQRSAEIGGQDAVNHWILAPLIPIQPRAHVLGRAIGGGRG